MLLTITQCVTLEQQKANTPGHIFVCALGGTELFCQQVTQVKQRLLNRAIDGRIFCLFHSGDVGAGHTIEQHTDTTLLDRSKLGNGLVDAALLVIANDLIGNGVLVVVIGFLNVMEGAVGTVIDFLPVDTLGLVGQRSPFLIELVRNGHGLIISIVIFDFDNFHSNPSKSFKSFSVVERLGGGPLVRYNPLVIGYAPKCGQQKSRVPDESDTRLKCS